MQVCPDSILKGFVTTWFLAFEMEKTLPFGLSETHINAMPDLTWLVKGEAGSYTKGIV